MDRIREQLNNPLTAGITGLVVGLILGLVVLGWGLFPVEWTDASPEFLRPDIQQDYLRMAVDSFARNPDRALALQRFQGLGPDAAQALADLQANPGYSNPADVQSFALAIQGGAPVVTLLTPAAGVGTVAAPAGTTTGRRSILPVVAGISCGIVLLVGAALAYIFLIRNRPAPSEEVDEEFGTAPRSREESHRVSTEYRTQPNEPPVAQFMTTYMAGDDLYDDSFSIDSPSGEFLGECGAGISETLGLGEPKKVTAYEVWLFDKNDIQTVTKVLMSHHAFDDPAIRQKLESKGEPLLAEPGKRIILETATLILEARVVDMNYGQGTQPPSSFFDRLTLELAVWPKS